MAMNVLQSPSRPGLGKVSGFFWRNPGLGLFLLLLGPLMWFGIVYFGSLLTLLWQGFYTFDDFTMSVTPELTLANIRALFNPANYDIILRTLTMAVAVTIASAILAFPMAWYMARYTSGKMKAFFYIAVMLPMWASYIVKAYAWTLLLAKDGVAQWFLQHLGLEPLLTTFLTLPAVGGNTLSTSGLGRFLVFLYIWLPFMILPVQAALERLPPSLLQASADLGARPRQTFRYVVLPLAIRVLPLALSLPSHSHWAILSSRSWLARQIFYRQYGLFPAGGDWQYADGGGIHPGADCSYRTVPGVRETSGSVRCTLNAHRFSSNWRPGAAWFSYIFPS